MTMWSGHVGLWPLEGFHLPCLLKGGVLIVTLTLVPFKLVI